MAKLFEIAPGIPNSRLFDISDTEIRTLDDNSLRYVKNRMTLKYRRNVLRGSGLFRDDYFFAMNERRAIVDSELSSRASDRHAQFFGLSAHEIRRKLAQAEAEISASDPAATPGSPRLARLMIDRGLSLNPKTLDSLQDVENAIAQKNAQHKEID